MIKSRHFIKYVKKTVSEIETVFLIKIILDELF
jgi:hypothetical protein